MSALLNTADFSWPERRPESWKYTDLKRMSSALAAQLDSAPPTDERPCPESALPLNGQRATWLDGQLQQHDAALNLAQSGVAAVDFGFLPTSLQSMPHQAWTLELGESCAQQTVHLHFANSLQRAAVSNTVVQLNVAAGVHATLVEEHTGGQQGLALNQLHIELGEGATLTHVRLQTLAENQMLVAQQHARINSGARLQQIHLDWGGRLSRLASQLDLDGEEASLGYYALSGLSGHQHCDHQVEVRHLKPHCRSELRARGILDEAGRQVFNGKVYVARGAQKTDSDQLLRNLLLSDRAEVDAKPELEIYADDVRCAHGSTVGRLDDAALFYLRSRGLDEGTARRLLLLSFAERILEKIPQVELADYARQHFADHLSLRDGL